MSKNSLLEFFQRFSPCSKRMIAKVLSRKAERCFEEEKGAFCGNNKIENDSYGSYEECDVGGRLSGIDDKYDFDKYFTK